MRRFLKRFWLAFWNGGEEEEPLVEVVRAAVVDPQIKNSLFMMLRMESAQRKSAVQSLILRLQDRQAPDTLIQALSQLEDDRFAKTTLELLEKDLQL